MSQVVPLVISAIIQIYSFLNILFLYDARYIIPNLITVRKFFWINFLVLFIWLIIKTKRHHKLSKYSFPLIFNFNFDSLFPNVFKYILNVLIFTIQFSMFLTKICKEWKKSTVSKLLILYLKIVKIKRFLIHILLKFYQLDEFLGAWNNQVSSLSFHLIFSWL